MKLFGVYLRDKYGWPVTLIEGTHPFTNTMRMLIHFNTRQTWVHRKRTEARPWDVHRGRIEARAVRTETNNGDHQ